jgi:ammonia channel protein AmtB
VYDRTHSAFLAAVTYVTSVVPAFVGGVTLAWVADRFPRRTVMNFACDLARCALVPLMAVPACGFFGIRTSLIWDAIAFAASALIVRVLVHQRRVADPLEATTSGTGTTPGWGRGLAGNGQPSRNSSAAHQRQSPWVMITSVRGCLSTGGA